MSLPITIPYTFGSATSSIPLSQLDSDFTTVANAINGIGNGTIAIATANITNGTVSGNLTVSGALVPSSSFKRNRIINGNMVVDQRNNGGSVTPTNGQYTIDRWQYSGSQTSKFTAQQNAASITPPSGFTNYLGLTSSSSYSVVSSDYFAIQQKIEGFNIADLGWGTSNAKTVTLSFWVRSSLTGTFGLTLRDGGESVCFPTNYTISSANTWTYIQLTITGPSTGTYSSTNGTGIEVWFGLGYGSSYTGNLTQNTWSSGFCGQPSGAVNVVGTSGATFYITGVQLEVGSVATPYEFNQYSDQIIQCQRYYVKYTNNSIPYVEFAIGRSYSTTAGTANIFFPVAMRSQPTFGYTTPVSGNFDYGASSLSLGAYASSGASPNNNLSIAFVGSGMLSGGAFAVAATNVSTLVYLDFSAEL